MTADNVVEFLGGPHDPTGPLIELCRWGLASEGVALAVSGAAVGLALIYGVLFASLVLVLACLRFERKDLQ